MLIWTFVTVITSEWGGGGAYRPEKKIALEVSYVLRLSGFSAFISPGVVSLIYVWIRGAILDWLVTIVTFILLHMSVVSFCSSLTNLSIVWIAKHIFVTHHKKTRIDSPIFFFHFFLSFFSFTGIEIFHNFFSFSLVCIWLVCIGMFGIVWPWRKKIKSRLQAVIRNYWLSVWDAPRETYHPSRGNIRYVSRHCGLHLYNIVPSIRESHWLTAVTWAGDISNCLAQKFSFTSAL
jgi:hypothetical protein